VFRMKKGGQAAIRRAGKGGLPGKVARSAVVDTPPGDAVI